MGLSGLAALGPSALLSPTGALASEPWPTRPLRLIVPFAPGGAADSSARALADPFATALGQAVVVENRPGAGSAVGVKLAAQARDGHTLLMGSNSMVINPSLQPAIGYEVARDFEPVGMVSVQPLVLVVPAGSGPRSVKDLVAQAKARPGTLTAGNSGPGTLAHLTSELFAAEMGIDLIPVPYKGESALLPDLLGGLVNLGFLNLPSVLPHLKAGKLVALAVSAPQPLAELPGVPTLRSQGLPTLEVQGWAALLAPRGTVPTEALTRLEGLLAQALASEPVRARFAAIGVAPHPLGRAPTAAFLQQEERRYAAIIRSRGIRLE
ncbi:tripartite tricarboxylate transporter substrate binding protein [Ideonella sp. TBM-1]|uniref:Tripartite tricarboxylate transporter substrate binding protein n=2 Tax=Ideonella livida TaxID=2707176 RepID=A0A7C9PH80_9BURK|nr:tripartite tricarboxylate transporter substrate binding protein [Ideonella livida]